MNLRILSGELKGRFIRVPAACTRFRPTSQRSREAIASIVGERIRGAFVADVCAGSGAFGFEMLSRGARMVHFVENDKRRARNIEECARSFGVAQCCRVYAEDAYSFGQRLTDTYDIIYFDPPYEERRLAGALPALFRVLSEKGILLFEHGKGFILPDSAKEVADYRQQTRIYGGCEIDFFPAPGNLQEQGH